MWYSGGPLFLFPAPLPPGFFFGRLLWLASFANGVVVLKVGGCCLIVSVRRYGWDVLEKYFMGGKGGSSFLFSFAYILLSEQVGKLGFVF